MNTFWNETFFVSDIQLSGGLEDSIQKLKINTDYDIDIAPVWGKTPQCDLAELVDLEVLNNA